MKRKSPPRRAGWRYRDVLANFSEQQLAGIGAVAMTFNEAEQALHELLGPCLRCTTHHEVVASRINGMDGIVAIVRWAAKNLVRLDADRVEVAKGFWKDLDLSLNAFLEAKKFRDGVIHANIFDATTAIANQHASQHATYDVLLTVEALDWLTQTCIILADELRAWKKVLEAGSILMASYEFPGPDRPPLEQTVLDAATLALKHRPRRTYLGPAPKFPRALMDPSDREPSALP